MKTGGRQSGATSRCERRRFSKARRVVANTDREREKRLLLGALRRDGPTGFRHFRGPIAKLGGHRAACHRWKSRIGHLRDDFDFRAAIEDSGKSHKDNRSTSGALIGAVAYAVAILAEISRRQGDVLHCGECHKAHPLLVYRDGAYSPPPQLAPVNAEAPYQNGCRSRRRSCSDRRFLGGT
jgi:hypothetical protein